MMSLSLSSLLYELQAQRKEKKGRGRGGGRSRGERKKQEGGGRVKTNDVDPSLFFPYALIPVRVIREHCDLLSVKRKSASERIHCSGSH